MVENAWEDFSLSRVLLIDDEKNILKVIKTILLNEEFDVDTAETKREAAFKLKKNEYDIVLCDYRLPDGTGIEILEYFRSLDKTTPFIIITAYGSINGAVEAMQKGATHYIAKPIDAENLIEMINFHLSQKKLEKTEDEVFEGIIGKSKKMKELFRDISIVAKSDSSVLLEGESGTGKELVARAIHRLSKRKGNPFVAINCSAIPLELFENELFGHEKGAFTGALGKKVGKIEIAGEGTLFLDEISEMPVMIQAKLLRVLQEKEFYRLGGTDVVKMKCRVISATNKDLERLVEEGKFREDLFYRINVVHIKIPPLRERKEDIPLLVKHFLKKFNTQNERDICEIDEPAMEALIDYDWPGNVRELENAIERAVVMCTSDKIRLEHLPSRIVNRRKDMKTESVSSTNLLEIERRVILKVLEEENWNQTRSAKRLGISRKQLRTKMKNLGITPGKIN